MLSGDVETVFDEFPKGYLSAVYGRVKVLVYLRVFLSVLVLYTEAYAL